LNTLEIARQAVEIAQKLGSKATEAYILHSKALSIEVNNQEVETLKLAEISGVGIKTILDGRLGFAYSSALDRSSLEEVVGQSLANAKETTPDEYNVLPEPGKYQEDLDLYDQRIGEVPVEEKIEQARLVERSAREYDPRVKRVRKASYQDSEYYVSLVNSLGLESSYRGNYCGVGAFVVAEDQGEVQTGWSMDINRKYDQLQAAKAGREAGEKAAIMLGATTVGSQRVPIVFDPYVATEFLDLMSNGLTAEAVQKGKSLFAGNLGQQVVSSALTIIDDGRLENGIDSAPVDGEGVPTSRNVLIAEGVLQKFLYNTYTAKKEGVKSTGNGIRGSFKGSAEVGTTNFFIQPGVVSLEELLAPIEKGFYVTEVMGMHTANPISGDFSLGASGIWIEKGQKTKPVRGVAIAGNILELMENVDLVANDLRFFGSTGAPTVRIKGMSISGA